MHRMTDYIQDLRNLTICMAAISAIGMIGEYRCWLIESRLLRNLALSFLPTICQYCVITQYLQVSSSSNSVRGTIGNERGPF